MSSIFRRLLVTYLLIATAIILVISLLLSQSLERHFITEKQQTLHNTAEYLNSLLILNARGVLSAEELAAYVNIVGETANARVLILDFSHLSSVSDAVIAETLNTTNQELIRAVREILGGATILRQRYYAGDLGYVVAVGIPVRSGNANKGAIILMSPVYQIELTLARARQIILIAALITFFFAFPVVSLVARRISLPITLVSRAADELASGDAVDDITPLGNDELARLVCSFNDMKNKLRRMESMRNDLLAGVSHELRTPLTAIRGFVQALSDGVVPPGEEERVLRLALQETQRLTGLVNSLLDIARLESGAVSLTRKPVELGLILVETARLLEKTAAEHNVTIETSAESPCEILADEGRIRQVLLNVLTNAILYNRPGGRVDAAVTCSPGTAVITITDTGAGIAARHLPYVFEKFYRVEPSRGDNGGTGLGLALSKQIVEQHGGRLLLESTEGRGTTVTVTLPVHC
jgi:signal transduction histidine kinase